MCNFLIVQKKKKSALPFDILSVKQIYTHVSYLLWLDLGSDSRNFARDADAN